jgi:hypothetical protein
MDYGSCLEFGLTRFNFHWNSYCFQGGIDQRLNVEIFLEALKKMDAAVVEGANTYDYVLSSFLSAFSKALMCTSRSQEKQTPLLNTSNMF